MMMARRQFLMRTGGAVLAAGGLGAAREASGLSEGQASAPRPPSGIHVICLSSLVKRANWQEIVGRMLELDYISGACAHFDWARFEPQEGEYDWSLLDAPLRLAQERGKVAALTMVAQAHAPEWLMARCQTFTFEHIHPSVGVVTAPVPWDEAYCAALAKTVRAIGRHCDGHPALHYVTINGPSSLFGVETNFPIKQLAPAEAAKLAYTPERFEAGWKESVELFAGAFAKSRLGLGLHDQSAPGSPERAPECLPVVGQETRMRVVRAIRDHALAVEARRGKRLVVRLLGLSIPNPKYFPGPYKESGESISDYVALVWEVRDRADIALEAARVFNAPNVGGKQLPLSPEEFGVMLDIGVSHRANWLEIKQPDVWEIKSGAPYAPYALQLIAAAKRLRGE